MNREYLVQSFDRFGLSLTEEQTDQFLDYAELLVSWNQKMNLTAITEFDEIVWKHFIDSLAVYQSRNVSRETLKQSCIDIGTGAGFPGIPIKIMNPECKMTLVDSLAKRITFLDEVIKQCNLKKIETVHSRAEDLAQNPKYRENYHLCISRAVSNLSTLSEYCLPFIRKGGIFLSYKAGNSEGEIRDAQKAIKVFGGSMIHAEEFILRGTDLNRTLVIVKKMQNTPKKYPRKAGIPAKSPIH